MRNLTMFLSSGKIFLHDTIRVTLKLKPTHTTFIQKSTAAVIVKPSH